MDDALAGHRADTWEELCLFLGAGPSSFGGMLLTLIEKADPGNRYRLRAEFPRHVAAWEAWCRIAPCTWGELEAAIPAEAKRAAVTFDLSDPDAYHVIVTAFGHYAADKRAVLAEGIDSPSFARWARIADAFRERAEEAAG